MTNTDLPGHQLFTSLCTRLISGEAWEEWFAEASPEMNVILEIVKLLLQIFTVRESAISVVSDDVDNDECGDYNDDDCDDDNDDVGRRIRDVRQPTCPRFVGYSGLFYP